MKFEANEQKMVERHRGLVRSIASDIRRRSRLSIELEELEAPGFEGLLQAIRSFDPERGVVFGTFAFYRIRGAILDDCRRMGLLAPRRKRARARFEAAANEVLQDAAAVAPKPIDVVGSSDWIVGTLDALAVSFMVTEASASRSGADDTEKSVVETVMLDKLGDVVNKLSGEEAQVVRRYYFEHEPMKQIAADFGVSKSWVSRVHTRALKRMRRLLGGPGPNRPTS